MNISDILLTAGVSTALSTLVMFVFRTWLSERIKGSIQSEYQIKMENLKSQLKAESDQTLERLKNELQMASAERHVRFSKAFDQTAQTAAVAYEKLLALNDAVLDYTKSLELSDMPSQADCRKVVSERYADFMTYFRPKSLYLPSETAKRVQALHKKLHSTALNFMFRVEKRMEPKSVKEPDLDLWVKTESIMHDEMPELLESLADHFRKLLGISDMAEED